MNTLLLLRKIKGVACKNHPFNIPALVGIHAKVVAYLTLPKTQIKVERFFVKTLKFPTYKKSPHNRDMFLDIPNPTFRVQKQSQLCLN